jgi:hypothetical protein
MTPIDYAASALHQNGDMLTMSVADFSDADFLVRPCPGANHASWQFGHLIVAETGMVNSIRPGAMPALPGGFEEKFSKETVSLDDAKFFPVRKELVEQFTKTRGGTVAWIKSLSLADLDKETPERLRRFSPTIGQLLYMFGSHTAMHLGQIQVLRRRLGKPILF